MKFDLQVAFTFNNDISSLKNEVNAFLATLNKKLFSKDKSTAFENVSIKEKSLSFSVVSDGTFRPHNALLQIKNELSKEFGKKHHIGVRDISITRYTIGFKLDQKPLHKVTIPFATVTIKGDHVELLLTDVSEEFLRRNYIDRMISRIKEKVEHQHYEGKAEFWKEIWRSNQKKPVWSKDPTEEMVHLDWLKQGPTKGKWFFRPQATAIMKAMETIAIKEVLEPLGFQEIMESHLVPFDVWLKTGHLEGMPAEFYYVAEPASRDVEQWERFVDITKITKEVSVEELQKNVSPPQAGICYAQCPVIYWSFKGKTIADASLPVLVYDKTAVSCRYESGGRDENRCVTYCRYG